MRYHLLLLFSLFTFLTMNTAFAQCRVENVGNNAQVKLVVGEMNGANTLDSWDIRCDSEGDIIEPTTFQPADWKTYLEELARAYRIPANDIQTKLLLRLSTKGVVQKEWTFDMTRDPITVDSGSYQLAANENYRLTVESLIKVNYSEEPIMSRSTIYSPSDLTLLRRGVGTALPLVTMSVSLAPRHLDLATCVRRYFEVRVSPNPIIFKHLNSRAMNQGVSKRENFSISVTRKKKWWDLCNIFHDVYPHVIFTSPGALNSNGDLILSNVGLLFRILGNSGQKLYFNHRYNMGRIPVNSTITRYYKAEVVRDPNGEGVVSGSFAITMAYEVIYR